MICGRRWAGFARDFGCLCSALREFTLGISYSEKPKREHFNHGTLLERLEPPPSLKYRQLYYYVEATFPSRWWGAGKGDNWAAFLPNLVQVPVVLSCCIYLVCANYSISTIVVIEKHGSNILSRPFSLIAKLCL